MIKISALFIGTTDANYTNGVLYYLDLVTGKSLVWINKTEGKNSSVHGRTTYSNLKKFLDNWTNIIQVP